MNDYKLDVSLNAILGTWNSYDYYQSSQLNHNLAHFHSSLFLYHPFLNFNFVCSHFHINKIRLYLPTLANETYHVYILYGKSIQNLWLKFICVWSSLF